MIFSKCIQRSTWLFNPYVTKDQTSADILIPNMVLAAAAIMSALPCFDVKGIIAGTIYMVVSFLLLCFLRNFVFCTVTHPRKEDGYVSPSLIGLGDLYALGFPSLIWICVSFGIAYELWGWQLK